MKKYRLPVFFLFLFHALFLLAFVATNRPGPLGFLFRNVTWVRTVRNLTQWSAILTFVGLLVCAALVAIPAALQPASRWRKWLAVLPLYFLGLVLVGVVLMLARIGTLGGFAAGWIGVTALFTVLGSLIALLRAPLSRKVLRTAMVTEGLAVLFSLGAWMGTVATTALMVSFRLQAGQNLPGLPPGPGGPSGRQFSSTPLVIWAVFLTLFVLLELLTYLWSWRAARHLETESVLAPRMELPGEVLRIGLNFLAITLVGFVLIQLVPVKRSNPPAQTAIQWDSPQTSQLFERACADCHSNATVWPWYAHVAPGSWLLASHVSSGRQAFNLSDLNQMLAFRRQELPNNLARNIRQGVMPPADYLIMHPAARLSQSEKNLLIQGLQTTLQQ